MSSCMNDNEINALLKRLGCPLTIEECRSSYSGKPEANGSKEAKPVPLKKTIKVKYAVLGRPIEERPTLFEAKPVYVKKSIIVKALKEEAGEGFDVIEIFEE